MLSIGSNAPFPDLLRHLQAGFDWANAAIYRILIAMHYWND
jgi:hypothetical protein